ncbi:MAG: cyclic nucleotide-binding domain-containing protein [Verrucomicrobia bacterium]|nr:cyclic nucleotide-binding domain-containing protein [Verrucomicrobiota bacterium]
MDDGAKRYWIWGQDRVASGPMAFSELVAAARRERLPRETWVFNDQNRVWLPAASLPELEGLFCSQPGVASVPSVGTTLAARPALRPGSLRRIKILAGLDEAQLAVFLRYVEVEHFQPFTHVVRAGEHGDAMYLVLQGELRASLYIDGQESILATLTVGDFFGEVSVLDQGPRSADVIANEPSVLLKVSAAAFQDLVREVPTLAAPLLVALSRAVVRRVRVLTRRYQDSIHFARVAGAVSPVR